MSTRQVVVYVDDLDGTPATERVRFGFDGTLYDIDLSEDNSDELHELIARYAAAGRPASPVRRPRSAGQRRPVRR